MRGNTDSNRPAVMWTKSTDGVGDSPSSPTASSSRKTSEICLIPAVADSTPTNTDVPSKVYQRNEQRPNSLRSNEPRRSKSRVRTYLKRCKDAIIGVQTPSFAASPHDQFSSNGSLDEIRATAKSSTSSWYVNELFVNRNETNESSATAVNASGETECVIVAGETATIVDENSMQSGVEIGEAAIEYAVSMAQLRQSN